MIERRVSIEDRLDVYPGEVALYLRVTEQCVRGWFERGYILVDGDFSRARKVGRLWRGSRIQWEEIKKNTRAN